MKSDTTLAIRIPASDLEWLRERATDRRTTVASVVRLLVAEAMKREEVEL